MTKIKICGLFRDCDVDYVNEALPDYIGFVFAKSRRRVSIEDAKRMREHLDHSIQIVGVFVNAPKEEILSLCESRTIDLIQLHGTENADYIKEISQICQVPVIKAWDANGDMNIVKMQNCKADYLLLDHKNGGTGATFDWSRIPNLSKPFFLAGGINLENISDALKLKSYCIDVSSGVETEGYKDKSKIIQMVQRIRRYNEWSS